MAVQQPRQAASVRVPVSLGQGAARVELAKVIERNIEELITNLEELWMPSNVSEARNQERLAQTSRILVQMDAQTNNLASFLEDHAGFCKAYVSILISLSSCPCPWHCSKKCSPHAFEKILLNLLYETMLT